MTEANLARAFIIQVDRPGERLDIPAVAALLDGTGVRLDGAYGPVLIDPHSGRHVVRGEATPEARRRAEAIPGVRFFADIRQEPMS